MGGVPAPYAPCIPVRRPEPPTGPEWQHEPKLDGWRCLVERDAFGRVSLSSRGGYDLTERAAVFAQRLATALPRRPLVLDGELVAGDDAGAADFAALSGALKRRPGDLCFMAFDVLSLDGADLRPLPLISRRKSLERLLARGVTLRTMPAASSIGLRSSARGGPRRTASAGDSFSADRRGAGRSPDPASRATPRRPSD